MLRLPLRWKFLLSTGTLLVLLIGGMLGFVNYQAEQFVNEGIAAEFEQSRQRIRILEDERLAGLRLTAQLVASFPDLKALLATDVRTVRDFLTEYQSQNQRAELLIVLDPAGRVVARTDVEAPEPVADAVPRWAQPALAEQSVTGILSAPRGVYHAAAVPAAAGGIVFGFVIAGAPIDAAFAQNLRGSGDQEIAILGERVLASTLPVERLPWQTRQEWESAGAGSGERLAEIGGETYAMLPVELSPGKSHRPLAIVLRSRDLALRPYRRIQFGLVVLGLIAFLAGLSGSAVAARTITAPVGKLVEGTRQVAAGNFETPIEVRTGDEIGHLAESFNDMMKGLRERAHMQKFVSQSTMDMIRADSPKKEVAGERTSLTVFFSDIRGFTQMSEERPPEEVVKILNHCLSLQADMVHKYRGDIDKYVGDCVVAHFFGEQGPMNAVQCAMEIEKALEAFNAQMVDAERLEVGIGIVTGEVILGSIGSEDRRDFTAVGSNVNLCARLCATAGPGEILLAESSYRVVQHQVPAERLEPLTVKGFSKAIPVYRIRVAHRSSASSPA